MKNPCDIGLTCHCGADPCGHQCWDIVKDCGHSLGECDC